MYYRSSSMQTVLLDSLNRVMDRGIEIMGKNPNEDIYRTWHDYAKGVLESYTDHTKDYTLLKDYLDFVISIFNYTPADKLKLSIQRLMDYYRYIGSQRF